MDFFYENQNSNSFLVYRLEERDKLDSFNYGMLANNKINGIIPANITQVNTDRFLKYNVSSTVTLSQYFAGVVNKNRLVNVFLSIVSALIDAEDYMIDTSMFVMDTNYIYVDVSSATASIICFPMVGYSCDVKLIDFFKNIIFTTQYDRTENSDYVAEIITFLNSGDSFSVQSFKKMLQSLETASGNPAPVPAAVPIVQPAPKQPAPVAAAPAQPMQPPQAPPFVQAPPQTPPQAPPQPASTPNNGGFVPKPNNGNNNKGFVMPQKNGAEQQVEQPAPEDNGKKMTFMHLMSNFSKENLELYKAQKNAKASGEAQPASSQPMAAPPVNADKKDKKKNKKHAPKMPSGNPVAGFAIPGMNNADMAIPSAPSQPAQQPAQAPAQPAPRMPKPAQAPPKPASPPRPVQAPPRPAPMPQQPPRQPVQMPQQPAQTPQPPVPTPQPAMLELKATAFDMPAMDFGGTTALGAAGGTTVLGASGGGADGHPVLNPRLIRSKNNESISINKPAFRIGKEHSYVDYFIADNTAISRSHAIIETKGNQFFVIDTNSTNHTYVNGIMIQSNVEAAINDKDMIRFANEDFEFRIY